MEKRLTIGDYAVNIQWLRSYSPGSAVLVFLHEALGSIVQWRNFPEMIVNELQLPGIIIERRGHGHSDPLPAEERSADYLHRYTTETKAILDELLPLGTPVILIGHSDGGTIALLYAKHYPKNIIGICTMAAHTFVEPETLAGIEPAVQAWESGKLDGLKRIHGDKTERLFYAWANTWRAPFFHDWDIREEIKGIACPVLAIQGAADQYGTEEQLNSIHEAAPQADVRILPDCGHHPHIEKKEAVLKEICDWVKVLKKF